MSVEMLFRRQKYRQLQQQQILYKLTAEESEKEQKKIICIEDEKKGRKQLQQQKKVILHGTYQNIFRQAKRGFFAVNPRCMYVCTQRRIFLILSLQQTPAGFIAHDYWVYVVLSSTYTSAAPPRPHHHLLLFAFLFIYFFLLIFFSGAIKPGNFTWQLVTFIIYLLFLFFILLLLAFSCLCTAIRGYHNINKRHE